VHDDDKEKVVGISRDLADIDYEDSAFIIGKHLRIVSEEIMGFFHELNQPETQFAQIGQSKPSVRSVRYVNLSNSCNDLKSTVTCCLGKSIKVDCYFNDIKIVRSKIELADGQTNTAKVSTIFFESSRMYKRRDHSYFENTRSKLDNRPSKDVEPEPEIQNPQVPRTTVPNNKKEVNFSSRPLFDKISSLQSDTKVELEEESLEVTFDNLDANSGKPQRRKSYLRRTSLNPNSTKTSAKKSANQDDERNEFRQSVVDASSTRKITLVAYDSSNLQLERNVVISKMKVQIIWVLSCVFLVFFGTILGAYLQDAYLGGLMTRLIRMRSIFGWMTKSGLQYHQSFLLLTQVMFERSGYSSRSRYSDFFTGETFDQKTDFNKEIYNINYRYLQMHIFTSRFDRAGFGILNRYSIKPQLLMGNSMRSTNNNLTNKANFVELSHIISQQYRILSKHIDEIDFTRSSTPKVSRT